MDAIPRQWPPILPLRPPQNGISLAAEDIRYSPTVPARDTSRTSRSAQDGVQQANQEMEQRPAEAAGAGADQESVRRQNNAEPALSGSAVEASVDAPSLQLGSCVPIVSLLSKMIRPIPDALQAALDKGTVAARPGHSAPAALPAAKTAPRQPRSAPAAVTANTAADAAVGAADPFPSADGNPSRKSADSHRCDSEVAAGGDAMDAEVDMGAVDGGGVGSEGQDSELENAFGRLTGLLGSGRGLGSTAGQLPPALEPIRLTRGESLGGRDQCNDHNPENCELMASCKQTLCNFPAHSAPVYIDSTNHLGRQRACVNDDLHERLHYRIP